GGDMPPPILMLLLALLNGSLAFVSPYEVSGTNHTATLPLRPRQNTYDTSEPDDYYGLGSDPLGSPPPIPSRRPSSQPCDYDSCREHQTPCSQLAASSGCLCPGVTGPNVVPEAPFIKRLTTEGSTVVIQWCAPNSVVTHYNVTVGKLKTFVFGEGQRSGAVGEVSQGEEVCMVAVNNKGFSDRHVNSCKIYNPPGNNSLALKAGLIGGTLGLLLLLSLAFLLWRHRAQRKADARITHTTEETL
uniref:Uncharacterized protein n=1 Tax=Esox lucius TaxID=8010 RepID=A0AAY5K8C2_ESOLU